MSLWDDIQDAVGAIKDFPAQIARAIREVIAEVDHLLNAPIAGIQRVFGVLSDQISSIPATLRGGISNALAGIDVLFDNITAGIAEKARSTWRYLDDVRESVTEVVVGVLHSVDRITENMKGAVSGAITDVLGGAWTAITDLARSLKNATLEGLGAIGVAIVKQGMAFKASVRDSLSGIGRMFNDGLRFLSGTVDGAIRWAGDALAALGEVLTFLLQELLDLFSGVLDMSEDAMTDIFRATFRSIQIATQELAASMPPPEGAEA